MRALFVAVLVLGASLAGCASDEPTDEPVRKGSTDGTIPSTPSIDAPVPKPKGTSERWHFHDYWKGRPTIPLVDANVTFVNVTTLPGGAQVLSAFVDLPHGTIVPPETGTLTLTVGWDTGTPGVVNVSYRPADSNDFFAFGDLANDVPANLSTTESMADVPHRQVSAWRFNLTAVSAPSASTPTPGLPPQTVRFFVNATIGRPLFIDPPHLNWWQGGDTINIVSGAAGEFQGATTPATNVTLPGITGTTSGGKTPSVETYRVPVDEGRIVPEGTKTIVVMLNWTSNSPPSKLTLRFKEANYPSEGPMELASDASGARIFVLKVAQAQTDTTYSNRTTWEFRVVPEGNPAGVFEGSFTLVAWATKLEGPAAIAAATGVR